MKIYLLLAFLIPFFINAQEEVLPLEAGFQATYYGLKKDRNDGVFKDYDFVWKQNENLYVVKKKILLDDGYYSLKSWLVNAKGEKITKKTYTDISDFSEGIAEVTVGPKDFCNSSFWNGRYSFMVFLNRNRGFINTKGEEIIRTKYKHAEGGFKNGLSLVGYWDNNLFYINAKDEPQFNKIFHHAEPFRGQIAEVTYKNKARNFINTKGENLIPKTYQYIQPYSLDYPGMIRAFQPKGGKMGFWTSNCEPLLIPQFEDFNYSQLKHRILVKKDSKYGFIDFFKGKLQIPIVYDDYRKDKNYDFVIMSRAGTWYRVDTANKVTKLVKAKDLISLGKGIYKFLDNKAWGIVDSTGFIKSEALYSYISNSFNGKYLPVKNNDKYGYLNAKGKTILEPIYDKVGHYKNGKVICEKWIHQYEINESGEIINKNIRPDLIKKSFITLLVGLMIGLAFYAFKG